MRALGHHSISSVLKLVVDAIWVIACAALGFVWLVAIVSFVAALSGGEFESSNDSFFLSIAYDSSSDLLAWTLLGSIACLGTMIVCSVLRGVFETLVAGDPFVPENAVRLRRIGLVLAILELSRTFVRPLIMFFTEDKQDGIALSFNVNLVVWGAVLVLIVLSQIFDEGARLREEQKMTI